MREFRYIELAGKLRTDILSGYLKPGQFLLPEKELCQVYDISRNSLRQALELLTNEGLLVKMVGRGTMVNKELDISRHGNTVINIVCPQHSSYVLKALPILIDMFKEHYPNVEFRQFATAASYEEFLQDLANFGVNADIVIMSNHDMQRLPLDKFLTLEDIVPEQTIVTDKLLQVFSHSSVPYAIPLTYSPVFLACNPLLFASNSLELPQSNWSWEQFVEAAKAMTRDSNGDGLNDIYGFGLSSSIYRWPVLARKHSYQMRQEPSGMLNTEGLQELLDILQSLIYREGVSPILAVNDWELLAQLFDEGRLGMFLTTTLTTSMTNASFPVTVIPLPTGPQAYQGNLAISNGMMIPKTSSNAKLAKQFAQFTLRIDYQRRMASEAKFLSIYSQVNEEVWTERERNVLGMTETSSEPFYFMNEMLPNPLLEQILEQEMNKFWAGIESSGEFIDRMTSILHNALAQDVAMSEISP
ncbi:extracellular solute-binding protein [Cohnella fermenti]|uniref:Extracellular solute-binding protein n=1 Tax=Cohnella fermenti TaxID=2565925 RepID=A0A4S4C8X0_9BACL|nr:extracellular solute-binding protein [Cohnella fermenti]THF84492.1 extracellular solute-binding protein [Cohnella fermenti]